LYTLNPALATNKDANVRKHIRLCGAAQNGKAAAIKDLAQFAPLDCANCKQGWY
jgi:hypothetical protein